MDHLEALLQVRWTNVSADRITSLHVGSMTVYWDEVIQPAVAVLVPKSDRWRITENLVESLELEDFELAYRYTMQGFSLVVQSMWERQLRTYLLSCAKEQPELGVSAARLKDAKWPELQHDFLKLRGVPLSMFESFEDLDLLQTLGNACRHGDGGSARKLFRVCPDIRDQGLKTSHSWWREDERSVPAEPTFERVTIPAVLLQQMVQSVIWFWEDQEIVFLNSQPGDLHKRIGSVDKCLEQRKLRQRVWTPS